MPLWRASFARARKDRLDPSLFGSVTLDEGEALSIEVEKAWSQPRQDSLANVLGHPHAMALDLAILGHARGVGEQIVRSNRWIRRIAGSTSTSQPMKLR